MGKGPPPPGNKKDEYTNFWNKGKWKSNMLKSTLDISGRNIRGPGATMVAWAMMKNKWVSTMDVSHNDLRDDGMTEFSQLLKVNVYLLYCNFACNNISDVGGIAAASAFIPTPSPNGQPGTWNRTLCLINLSCNDVKDDTAIALGIAVKYCRDLTKIDVSYNKIGSSGIKALYSALKFNQNIVIVSHHNPIADDGAIGVVEALKVYGVPGAHASLNMAMCDIGKPGADAMGSLILQNNFVQDVVLANNTIGDVGCQAIMKGLLGKSIVRTVSLQHNCLGDDCGEDIGRVLEANIETLTTINLAYNGIGDVGASAIAKALLKNTTLGTLFLNNNEIGSPQPNCVDIFCEVIRSTKTLKVLYLQRNGLKEEVRMRLSDAQKSAGSAGFRMDYGASESIDPGEDLLKKLADNITAMKQRAAAAGGRSRGGA